MREPLLIERDNAERRRWMKTETQRLGGALWSLNGEDMVVGSLLDLEVAGFYSISAYRAGGQNHGDSGARP